IVESDSIQYKGKNSSALSKLKTFYRTCMDEKTIDSIGASRVLQLISELGSWTVTTKNITQWNRQTWSLQTTIEKLHVMGIGNLFFMRVLTDQQNTSRHNIWVLQSGVNLHPSMYNNSEITDTVVLVAQQMAVLLGGDVSTSTEKLKKAFEFEKNLALINVPVEKLQNPVDRYKKITIGQLKETLLPWFNFTNYLNVMFGDREIPNNTEVIYPTPSYFTELKQLINNTDKEVLANYLMISFVSKILDYLPTAFKQAELKLTQLIYGLKTLSPREDICLSKTRQYFGFAISSVYVERYFSAESKTKVSAAIEEIKHEFIANLKDVKWMDDVTREKIEEKAYSITNNIGYPDWILDVEKLDEYFEDINIIDGEYLKTILNFSMESTFQNMHLLWETPARDKWLKSPDEVNAYYGRLENNVVVMAAILQPPFFIPTFPDSFNYGTIGMIAGHEVTHGFDSSGRYYDKDGNLGDIWTKPAAAGFAKGAECFKNQYNSYSVQGENLDGLLTLGENIADNAGVKLAYQAYKKSTKPSELSLPGLNLTDDQLYFVGFSQLWCALYSSSYEKAALKTEIHSNNRYRVIGSLSNNVDFAKAFNCPVNSPMNPENKCKVW
ncbi:Endothelin-converting enzyme 1, partial [Bulinus truncatus]